jgi:hypothetical protein
MSLNGNSLLTLEQISPLEREDNNLSDTFKNESTQIESEHNFNPRKVAELNYPSLETKIRSKQHSFINRMICSVDDKSISFQDLNEVKDVSLRKMVMNY